MTTGLRKLWETKLLSDISLRCFNEEIEIIIDANKCILASNSPYFSAMFTNNWIETEQQIIDIYFEYPQILEQEIKSFYISTENRIFEDKTVHDNDIQIDLENSYSVKDLEDYYSFRKIAEIFICKNFLLIDCDIHMFDHTQITEGDIQIFSALLPILNINNSEIINFLCKCLSVFSVEQILSIKIDYHILDKIKKYLKNNCNFLFCLENYVVCRKLVICENNSYFFVEAKLNDKYLESIVNAHQNPRINIVSKDLSQIAVVHLRSDIRMYSGPQSNYCPTNYNISLIDLAKHKKYENGFTSGFFLMLIPEKNMYITEYLGNIVLRSYDYEFVCLLDRFGWVVKQCVISLDYNNQHFAIAHDKKIKLYPFSYYMHANHAEKNDTIPNIIFPCYSFKDAVIFLGCLQDQQDQTQLLVCTDVNQWFMKDTLTDNTEILYEIPQVKYIAASLVRDKKYLILLLPYEENVLATRIFVFDVTTRRVVYDEVTEKMITNIYPMNIISVGDYVYFNGGKYIGIFSLEDMKLVTIVHFNEIAMIAKSASLNYDIFPILDDSFSDLQEKIKILYERDLVSISPQSIDTK